MTSADTAILANVDGWPVTTANRTSAVQDIIGAAKSAGSFTAFTLNLDHLVKLRRNTAFRNAYEHARIVTADGAPVAWMARAQNRDIERTTGADLMVPLAQAAAEAHLPVFLFGTSPEVMARAGRELGERTDGLLDIAGTFSPSGTFDPEGPEADAAIERIRRSGAKLCFVALGAPKQEIFAERARTKDIDCGFVCIGASLDFLAGAQIRAPEFMRNNGLEWLWRLSTNPRRLAYRYGECAALFFELIVIAPLKQRLTRG